MTEVLPTIGAYDALFTTFQSLICPGDEASCTLSCCSGCLVLSRGNDHLNFYTNLLSFRLVKHFKIHPKNWSIFIDFIAQQNKTLLFSAFKILLSGFGSISLELIQEYFENRKLKCKLNTRKNSNIFNDRHVFN